MTPNPQIPAGEDCMLVDTSPAVAGGGASHTPGPWTAIFQAEWPHRQDVYITAQGWGAVARMSLDKSIPNFPRQRANLQLIAAAPELLEALLDCRRALEIANFTQELAVVDAAIAKATGVQA